MIQLRQGKWIPVSVRNLNRKRNNDFLIPVLLNTIIEQNLVVYNFSPKAGGLHSSSMYMINNNDIFMQVRKGETLVRLVSLETQGKRRGRGQTRTNKRAGNATLTLMFFGLVAAMMVPIKGKENFGVVRYDCSNPSNIKVYDSEACCQHDQEVQGEREKVKILQIVNTEKLSSFKCKVKSQRKLYYCGLFSYSKPILLAEEEETLVISTQDCRNMANTKIFVTPQTRKSKSLVVPGQSFIMEFKVGFQTTSNSAILCQGMDVLLECSIQNDPTRNMR